MPKLPEDCTTMIEVRAGSILGVELGGGVNFCGSP